MKNSGKPDKKGKKDQKNKIANRDNKKPAKAPKIIRGTFRGR